jgi:hypothetical protein
MTGLLSLPNELLIRLLGASPTTRSLLIFARVNRQLHAVWMAHSDQIITDVYNLEMPHFQDAVDFTLAQACQAVSMTTNAPASEAGPPCRHLPRILRDVDLAVKTCDQFTQFRNSLPPDDLWYEEPTTSLYGAYFILRRAVMGYTLPELRPGLRSELRSLQASDLETSQRLLDYIRNFASYDLRCELECVLTEEEMERVPIDDQMTRLPLGWRHAGILLDLALQEKEDDVNGMLEELWTSEPVDEEDMEYSDTDSYSDLDEFAHSAASDRD